MFLSLARWAQRISLVGLVIGACAGASASTEWSAGLSLEARLQSEVNPQYSRTQAVAGLFTRARKRPWGGIVEVSQSGSRTQSGQYSVFSRTRGLAAWGRYEPWDRGPWFPFVGVGAGALWDRVESSLGKQSRADEGRRLFVGGGLGVTRSFFEVCVIEIEARALSEEQGRAPALSGWMRLGFSL